MYLFFVRHGDPCYETDSLTDLGRRQAQLTAERLVIDGITEIHASTMGRAKETASYLAEKLSLPVIEEPWATELGPETRTTFPDGIEKGIGLIPSPYFTQEKYRRMTNEEALSQIPGLCEKGFPAKYQVICGGLDRMMERLGYRRTEDDCYLPVSPNKEKVALFCHGAMIRSVIGHLLNIPYQYLGTSFHENHCGVTIFKFDSDTGGKFVPKLISFGDLGHLYRDGGPQHFYLDGDVF